MLRRIDAAGAMHDRLMEKYPRSVKHNRRRFIKSLRRLRIDIELIDMIHAGLFIYDISPMWLKRLMKHTAGEELITYV